MATIVDYGTANGQGECAGMRVQVGNEDFCRPFSFGNRWSRIMIGIRFTICMGMDRSTLPALASRYCLGVNNGSTNTFSTPYCDGCYVAGPGSDQYFNANSTTHWPASGATGYAYGWYGTKFGNTYSPSLYYMGVSNVNVAAQPTYRAGAFGPPSHHYITILRGHDNNPAGRTDIGFYFQSTSHISNYTSRQQFWRNMEKDGASMTNCTGFSYQSTNRYDRNLNMDTAMVVWNFVYAPLEILDFNVVRYN